MKVLLPLDGSECASKTLAWAARMFDPQTTEYYLLYVVPIIPDMVTVEYDIVDATAILRKARQAMEQQGCLVKDSDYQLGNASEQICRYADVMDIDQVVIGSHGRSGLNKFLMGSTGEAVLEHCNKPVIVYRNIERKPAEHKMERKFSSHTVL